MRQLTPDDPTHIARHRLLGLLGEGGMGRVYLGRSESGRTVAVKVIQREYARDPEFRRRFAREVQAARSVGGEWTAAVLDADTEAAVPWVSTQYVPGPDLHTVVSRDYGPLPEHSVRTLANRLALALQAIHGAGLVHRDLKPSNVLVTVDGPRVIDFGIARALDALAGDTVLTRSGAIVGSPGFMSPEQVRGEELTPASDVFCLGAVLVYAATGRQPFGGTAGGSPHALMFRVVQEEPDVTGVPDTLTALVHACLSKDPTARPTPRQIAEATGTLPAGTWLPGEVLAQLGSHAARLLDLEPGPEPQPARPTPTAYDNPAAPLPAAPVPTYAQPTQPAAVPPPRPPMPAAPPAGGPQGQPGAPVRKVRRGPLVGAVLTVLAMLALWGGALPLMAFQIHLWTGDGRSIDANESTYELLGLDQFPEPAPQSSLLSWSWLLLALLAQAVLVYRATEPRLQPVLFLRLLGYACALALPVRLTAAHLSWDVRDLTSSLPSHVAESATLSYEGGWWLLHAGALLGLAAFVWQDLRSFRTPAPRL
ncbi:serine/threonine protein kinase [Streptomyces sp. NBC_00250]|uniref:serine/threonine-protein kinase n=1 Tax=Streptomyces sp. NBC_00250 TaxID=2903641 RepID=UPI002E2CFB9E|nr:serine/threonine-protein kinase [Streptomyces sp. NBC_00250]